ncbi:hypothetical protein TWF694_004393 [Orbilia ellipsospora]|uniref:Uncharacterized protein n=1 Tax=Orbilia ellipsospora TaxID=2528407 RepID=A0AAV9WV51_9PEZI
MSESLSEQVSSKERYIEAVEEEQAALQAELLLRRNELRHLKSKFFETPLQGQWPEIRGGTNVGEEGSTNEEQYLEDVTQFGIEMDISSEIIEGDIWSSLFPGHARYRSEATILNRKKSCAVAAIKSITATIAGAE